MADKNTLKQWFVTGAKPVQAQYWAWLDSYWHKSEAISINNIENLSEILGNKVDADQLALYAKKDASNIDVPTWKTRLGVGELPPNIGTIDYTNSEGFSYVGNAYKKIENPNDGKTYLLKIDGTAVDGDTFGKNVSNSYLTSLPNTGLKLGAIWELDSNGFPLRFKNLPDKSADSAFNLMLAQDSSGQIAKSNGKNLLKGMPSLLSDVEKTTWKIEMNGGWTTNTMSVYSISPFLVNNNNNNNTYFTCFGANLNFNPVNFSVKILRKSDLVEVATVPNNQVQLNQNGISLTFYYNINSFPVGEYIVQLWNGIAIYNSIGNFNVVPYVNIIDYSNNTWVINKQTLNNYNQTFQTFNKQIVYDAGLSGDKSASLSIPIASAASSALFNSNDDFYLELQTSVSYDDWGYNNYIGISTTTDLVNDFIISFSTERITVYRGTDFAYSNQGVKIIIVKQGNNFSYTLIGAGNSVSGSESLSIFPNTPLHIKFLGMGSDNGVKRYLTILNLYKLN